MNMTSLLSFIQKSAKWIWQKPWWFKIVALLLVGIGTWYGYSYWNGQKSASVAYQTAMVEKGNLVVSISASGQVSTANSASITTSATGVVKKVYAANGQSVKMGALIAELELDRESQQKYAQASSSYQSAKNSLEAAKAKMYTLQSSLFAANQKFINGAAAEGLATSDPNYIQQNATWLASEADYKNQQNVIAQAQASLNSSWLSLQDASPKIYAPISGTVVGLSLQNGSVIAANGNSDTASSSKIASVTTNAVPTVTVNLTEIDIPKIQVGNKATLVFDTYPDKTYTGAVVSVDTVGSVTSNVTTYPTVIALDTATPEILSNMSVQANIITATKDSVLLVPASAVETTEGQSTVKVMVNGQPQSKMVEVGLASDTQVEIVSGVAEGEVVVTGTTSSSSTKSTTTTSPFSMFGGAGGRSTSTVRIQR